MCRDGSENPISFHQDDVPGGPRTRYMVIRSLCTSTPRSGMLSCTDHVLGSQLIGAFLDVFLQGILCCQVIALNEVPKRQKLTPTTWLPALLVCALCYPLLSTRQVVDQGRRSHPGNHYYLENGTLLVSHRLPSSRNRN